MGWNGEKDEGQLHWKSPPYPMNRFVSFRVGQKSTNSLNTAVGKNIYLCKLIQLNFTHPLNHSHISSSQVSLLNVLIKGKTPKNPTPIFKKHPTYTYHCCLDSCLPGRKILHLSAKWVSTIVPANSALRPCIWQEVAFLPHKRANLLLVWSGKALLKPANYTASHQLRIWPEISLLCQQWSNRATCFLTFDYSSCWHSSV